MYYVIIDTYTYVCVRTVMMHIASYKSMADYISYSTS